MKQFSYLMTLLLSTLLFLSISSCVGKDDFDIPNLNPVTLPDANTSISSIKEQLTKEGESIEVVDELYVDGYVVTSDEAGNIFKTLSFQDKPENPTIGLQIEIDKSALYNEFPVGSFIKIYLKGLVIAKDKGVHKIGSKDEKYAVGRIKPILLDKHLFVDESKKADIVPTEFDGIADVLNDKNLNILITINNVQFADRELANSYANPKEKNRTENRTLVDKKGKTVIMRNSGYSSFASEPIPSKSGSVTAILRKYNSTYQLHIRDLADVNFENPRFESGSTPGNGGDVKQKGGEKMSFEASLFEDFESFILKIKGDKSAPTDLLSPKYANISADGGRYWQVSEFSKNKYIQMSANKANKNILTYLVVPVKLTGENSLSFKTKARYYNGDVLKVYWSDKFVPKSSPNKDDLKDITDKFKIAGKNDDKSFVNSGEFIIPTTGDAYIYFEYKGNEKVTTQFQIDDIKIGDGGSTPDPDPNPVVEIKKTIAELRAHKQGGAKTPENDWFVEGVVVSDKEGKNFQSYQIAVVDNSAENSGLVFSYLKGQPNPNFKVGTKVKVTLAGTKYGDFKNLMQVTSVKSDNVTLVSSDNVVEPVVVTAEQLLSGKYESMLVAINNTELVDKSKPGLLMNGSLDVVSDGKKFVMYTAKNAVFKDKTAPMGKGKLIGLAAIYDTKIQVLPRNENDYSGMQSVDVDTKTITVDAAKIDVEAIGGDEIIELTTFPADLAWTATLIDGATVTPTISPVAGKGNGSIKVTFPENKDTENSKTATVKLSTEGAKDVSVVFTQAKAKSDEPVYLTVKQVREKYTNKDVVINEDIKMIATVVSNLDGGNMTSKRSLVVQDATAGIAIFLDKDNREFKFGDKVEINLNGQKLSLFSGLLQISGLPLANIDKKGVEPVEPKPISAKQLLTGEYESQYVVVSNVQVVVDDLGKKMVEKDKHTSINLESAEGERFVMFSSKHASFKNDNVPQGSGVLKGIASINNKKIQLLPTVAADYSEMTNPRFGAEVKPKLSVDATKIDVEATGGDKIIKLTTSPADLAWTTTLVDGATVTPTISPVDGKGNGSIKVTFPENKDTENSKTATVKLSAEGVEDITVVFTQAKASSTLTSSFPATWDFNSVDLKDDLVKATSGNTEATIGVLAAEDFKIQGSKNKYIVAKDWKKDETAWVITLPVANVGANSVINLKFQQQSSGTGPKDFVVEFSTDNGSTWSDSKELNPIVGANKSIKQNLDITIANAISSGSIIIRLKVSSDKGAKGEEVIKPSGTSRLSGLFSITLK